MHERDLRRALDRREFRLHFQPVVRASTGAVVGAEALLRWDHPILGLLAPSAFLPTAEASGLLVPIGEWVVAEAIAERATWADGMFVSVNFSPGELAAAPVRGLVDLIGGACGAAAVAPSDVWVEVTEQPMFCLEATAATLHALRELGVRAVLDDFGAGHASVARLRDLPFDVCKLDRSFAAGLAGRGGTRVVAAAVAMARAFGTEVVTEGIETAEQLRQLDALGSDLLQGYHLGRPMPADHIREVLRSHHPHPGGGGAPEVSARPQGQVRCRDDALDHRVLYYDDDRSLAEWTADALAPALVGGDTAAIVVTDEHRRLVESALRGRGLDVPALIASGRLVTYDAAATLELLMEDGMPLNERLDELVAALLPADGRKLWVFGEMVALLWERGEVAAAMALEESWNACVAGERTSLLCAYSSPAIAAAACTDGYERIAQHHSHATVGGSTLQVDAAAVLRDPGRHVQELRSALAVAARAATAQVRLEAELRELQQRVDASGRFGAMVVHEMRNPASVLVLALDALRHELASLPGDEAQHLLDVATGSARSIERFAGDLLLSAQLDATEFAVRREPFDLGRTVLAAVERTATVSGREVTCDLGPSLPAALGDGDRLEQVLLNLLDNAVACSPAGTAVKVACTTEPERLVVRVADAGPGVPPEDRQRLFEPFTRSAAASVRRDGAGLGLHIVDRLVRAQHGDVWIEDVPSGGAVFAVAVPRACAGVEGEPNVVVDELSARAS